MNEASSLARNATAAAILGASANRPIGMCTRRRAARSGSLANNSWEHRCVDRTRAQRVDPDPLTGELHAQLVRHGHDPALGSRVGDLRRRRAHDSHERRGVDDRPAAPLLHVRDRVPAAQVHRREVDLLHPPPHVERRVEDRVVIGWARSRRCGTTRRARLGADRGVEQRRDTRFVGDVDGDERAADLVGRGLSVATSMSAHTTWAPSAASRRTVASPIPLPRP